MIARVFQEKLKEAIRNDPRPIKQLAFDAGYNYSHIRRVLSGERPNPTLQFVEVMADTLGVPVLYLLGVGGSRG